MVDEAILLKSLELIGSSEVGSGVVVGGGVKGRGGGVGNI